VNNFRKSVRYVKPTLILSILLMLLLPYSVMAEESEYKIPENSITYMAQANSTSQPFMAASEPTATLSSSERQELEPEFSAPAKTNAQIQIIPEPETKKTEEATLLADEKQYETPLFSEALSKMQQTRAHRQAEAERLGIVLPSQGGDIAAVSPSLSKIQQTLKNIMTR
jgi:hypothetical protein